jgi:hypothetical protein
VEYVQALINYLLEKHDWKKAIEMVHRFALAGDYAFTARLHEQILFYVMNTGDVLPDTIMDHARAAIDAWSDGGDHGAIEKLLAAIAKLDAKIAGYARDYWQKKQ